MARSIGAEIARATVGGAAEERADERNTIRRGEGGQSGRRDARRPVSERLRDLR
jgi:hypothetical protein